MPRRRPAPHRRPRMAANAVRVGAAQSTPPSSAISPGPSPARLHHLLGARRNWLLIGAVLVAITVRLVHLFSVYHTPAFSFHRTWTITDMAKFQQWAERIVAG